MQTTGAIITVAIAERKTRIYDSELKTSGSDGISTSKNVTAVAQ